MQMKVSTKKVPKLRVHITNLAPNRMPRTHSPTVENSDNKQKRNKLSIRIGGSFQTKYTMVVSSYAFYVQIKSNRESNTQNTPKRHSLDSPSLCTSSSRG
jgi:hypothetical protein